MAHRLLLQWGTFTPILILRVFVFELQEPVRDRQTDGRTNKARYAAYYDDRTVSTYCSQRKLFFFSYQSLMVNQVV